MLYASVGPELTQYDIDVDGAALTRRGTVTLPANVQYVPRYRVGPAQRIDSDKQDWNLRSAGMLSGAL